MDATAWIETGNSHKDNQAWDKAIAAYQYALTLDPTNIEAHNGLGLISHYLGNLVEAETHYQTALRYAPENVIAHYNLGLIYKARGDLDLAIETLDHALELSTDPKHTTTIEVQLLELTGQTYRKCHRCGNISTLGHFYKITLSGKALCPQCYSLSLEKRNRRHNGFWWIFAVFQFIVVMLCSWGSSSFFYEIINMTLLIVLPYLMLIPHELSHAGAAWLLKGSIFQIRLGQGPPLWERQIHGTLVTLGRYPLSGACAFAFPVRHRLRLRRFLAAAAGLLSSVFIIVLFLPGFQWKHLSTSIALREILVIVNGGLILSNLWPRRVNLGDIETDTDGAQLWQILTGHYTAELGHLEYFLYRALYALKAQVFAQALTVCEEGLTLYPASTLLKNTRATALLELGCISEARAAFIEQLIQFKEAPSPQDLGITELNRDIINAILLNNVAYTTLIDAQNLTMTQMGYDYARKAYRMAPWVNQIRGTWGIALVETGEIQTGIEHLLKTQEHPTATTRERAVHLTYLAIAHWRSGAYEKATEFLKQAQKLSADHYVVHKAEMKITSQ